jgi:hypothetical protein
MSHRLLGFRAIHRPVGITSTIEDDTDENAKDGILVVQVRRLRTISRKISEPADFERAEIEAAGFVS